jgi:hypothetical protein
MGFGAQGPGAAGTGSSTQKKKLWYASWVTGDDTRGTDIEKDPSLNGYTFKLVKPDAMEKTSFISDIVAVGGATTFTFATGLHKGQFVNTSLQTVNGLLTIALMIWADYDLNELPWYAKIGITLGMALIANFEGRWFGAGDAWLYFFRLFYNVLGIAGGLPPTGIATRRGIRVNYADARCAAQSFTPSAAVSASGLSVGVLALSADAKLSVEVRADQSGAPASVVLAQAKIGVAEPRRPQWVMVSFAKPAVVPAKPHWIVLGAAKGAFVLADRTGCGLGADGRLGGRPLECPRLHRWRARVIPDRFGRSPGRRSTRAAHRAGRVASVARIRRVGRRHRQGQWSVLRSGGVPHVIYADRYSGERRDHCTDPSHGHGERRHHGLRATPGLRPVNVPPD